MEVKSATNEPNRLIAASIGLARPADHSQYEYLSEHLSTGETSEWYHLYGIINRLT